MPQKKRAPFPEDGLAAWHSPEFKDSTLANNFETWRPDTRLWELGAHFGERHICLANSPLSLQSAISIKLSPLLVFTVVAPIIAIHKLQTLPFHSLLGRYLQVQFAIWLCHYHGGRCHYLFSSFAIFGCSGNTTNKTMLYTKCS